MANHESTFGTRVAFALSAGCGATLCVHPLDVTRVQMQLDAEGGAKRQFNSALQCAKHVLKAEGVINGLYAGISAGIFRQCTYGGPRMAIYPMLLDKFAVPGEKMAFTKRLALGSAAGGSAACLGVPAEVCLVRMGADSKKPAAERRNYKHVVDALTRIGREEGVGALWSGAAPTVARACLLNAGQLAVYSQAKEVINVQTGLTGLPLQFTGSVISAVAAVGLSCPADVMKSRMQNALPGQYTGFSHCAATLLSNEGALAFWKGFGPATIKLAPHSVISFIILDNLTRWYTGKDAM
eukprot:COSAG01_NODE_15604_length_1320_cov_1.378378_1_plen_296_part_00